jgi:hypothetical protein
VSDGSSVDVPDVIERRLERRAVAFQLVQRQGQECFDARAQDRIGFLEGGGDLFFGTDDVARIFHAPVRPQNGTEIGRAGFARCTGADGDDDVRRHRQVLPGLAVVVLGRDAFAGQQGKRAFVQLAGGLTTGADGLPAARGQVIEDGLADERAAGIAGAEEEYVHSGSRSKEE